ncbi:nicotinate-nucleotide--dimethylbenzimidazole phosphoribosyltransferase [Halobaculum sp. MBLA0147]|uniref:nicotinate-nucleotide--dimethylbenzimidazole phosphoribosyltransferase n=1 Tax=Halobaculum sp. MBLA0147 TaxID=3079934 RepID=UPI00352490FB
MTRTAVLLAAGSTRVAEIEGITAAGADPSVRAHTPAADAEILTYGGVAGAPVVPVSPSGTPTPAVLSRGALEALWASRGAENGESSDGGERAGTYVATPTVLDAGLPEPTTAPTVSLDAAPGDDPRDDLAVPDAAAIRDRATTLAESLPVDRLVIGETIPGGTTTAKAVLAALGERAAVSSSLPENPTGLKRRVVADALDVRGLSRGAAADDPERAVAAVGDPVLAAVWGLVRGAVAGDTRVVLGGGTQLAAAAALARHDGITADLELATTSFIAADDSAAIRELAADLDLALRVTDPGFDARPDHPATSGYLAGEAKEGVCAGGTLALASEAGVGTDRLRQSILGVYDRVVE